MLADLHAFRLAAHNAYFHRSINATTRYGGRLAGLGSVVAMTVVLAVLLTLSRGRFWQEFRESLKVKQHDALGEEAIERMRKDD